MFKNIKNFLKIGHLDNEVENLNNENEDEKIEVEDVIEDENIKYEADKIVKWTTLENNPGKISILKSTDKKHPDIVIADFLMELLKKEGYDTKIVENEKGNKWIHVAENDYYLLPLLEWIDNNENGEISVGATIQIQHKTIFPDGVFEYEYSMNFKEFRDAVNDAFYNWIRLDWQTLVDIAKPKKAKALKQTYELEMGDDKILKRYVYYGPVAYYPNFDIEKMKEAGLNVKQYIDRFHSNTMFTRAIEAFITHLKDENEKNYAIRMFALKAPNGDVEVDCRINGEEYPEANKFLESYAKTWKDCDIVKFKKQYVIISNVSY